VDDAGAALTGAECFEFASVLVGVGSGVEVDSGALCLVGSAVSPEAAVSLDFGSLSTPLVCVPPLLLTMTPDPTSVLDDVVPVVFAVPVAVVSVSVDVDPPVDLEPPPVVAEDPVDDSPVDVEVAELVEDESGDGPVVSAAASP
jgi:hypothetical protein